VTHGNGGRITLGNLLGNRRRHHLKAIAEADHRQHAAGQLIGHLRLHIKLLDFLAINKLERLLGAAPIQPVRLDQLPNLCGDFFLPLLCLALGIQRTISLNLRLAGLTYCLGGVLGFATGHLFGLLPLGVLGLPRFLRIGEPGLE